MPQYINKRHSVIILAGTLSLFLVVCLTTIYQPADINDKGESVHYDHNGVCKKGFINFSPDVISDEFKQFIEVYKKRPIAFNSGGTQLAHQFALWTMVQKLQPRHIIESGVHTGMGTWMLRQAAPGAQLNMIDPLNWVKNLKYRDNRTDSRYFVRKTFKDFDSIDWESLKVDKDRTLVFFDDHQSNVRRVMEAYKHGFKHVMFDDNYLYHQLETDSLSLKAACDIRMGKVDVFRDKYVYVDHFNSTRRLFTKGDVNDITRLFDSLVKIYFEFPFPWKHPKTKNVWFPELTQDGAKNKYGLQMLKLINEYVNICYVMLN